MQVTGFDDRLGTGYVLSTGAHADEDVPGSRTVEHDGTTVRATEGLAAMLEDALAYRPTTRLGWGGPEVPLTLDDGTLLAWLRNDVGGVVSVAGEPTG
ncbi:hypothetical protein Ae168Ps1_2116 [Pseudonocardia sp. Ae168_Ps1]|uniref:hypothetical protein n=1 Tax=unclassified Pseudonocardia TaxID=2619320 RepID=UPI0001FFE496|nr:MULTISPECIES: hypothetical protein [unclassified Pseudonocardia]OLL73732.1 hypothetical protein Ae150APs1_2110 [Pseudonocardia sp. Ae150A_Ps1]OLL79710.1 hypothetical protein Ae168Ps1_2116 [Pseudonocardia sp. Ae168_Ps1]OLL86154.1 hypothetical protein Ae263Ps1_3209c [Pseudonocardia sp. Ae263_Ps1]OLL93815.1 hypothetical protein Ae356Ps1_3712 [Pseudonocardia sp. Ae356_Ps1]OLM20323.1 hypothetical protein Ae707Ps1_4582 [Pseudonocardia sp. Ae707_Ps1]